MSKGVRVGFLGGARYSQPLDPTSEKKFRLLSEVGEMFVIGFSCNLKPRCFREHAHFYLLTQAPLPILRYLTMFILGSVLALWVIFRHDVNILVAQSPYEGFTAALAKKVSGWFGRRVTLVVENHGDFEESLFLQRRVRLPSLYRALMRWTARFALRHASLLRAVSNATRAQLEEWAPGKPLVQFVAWTDMEAFLAAGKRGDDRKPEVVYAGVLIPRKGVHHLINAFARVVAEFPEAKLIIIGRPENSEYADSLKRQVDRMGLNEVVEFVNELPQVELARRMARGCVFVLPSLSEALGRVVVEAMATGVPVIGSKVGGIPEMIKDGQNGFLVPPGDEETLAERLRWVFAHPEEAKRMGERAKVFAQGFFSAESYLEGYRRLFEEAQEICKKGKREDAPDSF